MAGKLGGRVVVAGPGEDRVHAGKVLAEMNGGKAVIWDGASVGSFAALLEAAHIVVCNNSLAMHLTAAVGTPCVAVAASGNPVLDRPPVAEERLRMLHKPLDCSPCYYWTCPRDEFMLCMDRITPPEVVTAAAELLSKH